MIRRLGSKYLWFVLVLWACLVLPLGQITAQASEGMEKRVALVIGNAKYKDSPLLNPVNDAQDMAAALRGVGFQVIERTDATQKEMNRAITQFGESLHADTVALFYYAGHGVQVKGKNYLIPVDAQITGESSIRAEAVDVDTVLDQLSTSGLNVVILDACRNNPFERRFRSISGGLAQMDAPKGSLIAYSTAPGKTAIDGSGRNGVYTQELLRQIGTPGLPLEAVLKNVRRSVARATNDQQIPWESSSLTGDFYFNSGIVTPGVAATPKTTPAGAANSQDRKSGGEAAPVQRTQPSAQFTAEDELWKAATEINTLSTYETYLAEFPGGRYAAAARLRLASLRPPGSAPAKAASTTESPKAMETARLAPMQESSARVPPGKIDVAPPLEAAKRSETTTAEPVAPAKPRLTDMSVKLRDMTFSGDFTVAPDTGLPTGKGKIAWSNGDKFEGEVKDGKPSGQGAYTLKSGEIYSGTWVNGKQEGKGRLTWANGGYWEGEFKDDQRVLTGPMTIKLDNVSITGVFSIEPSSNALTGSGKFAWANGDYYEGAEVQGVKQGKGQFSWASGNRYDGDWERDLPNGKGSIYFANGDRYEGAVRDGQPHGQGTFTHKSGDVYSGAWVGGLKHGMGRMTWAAGDYWEGEFKDDKLTESGRMVTAGAAPAAAPARGLGDNGAAAPTK